MDLFISFIKLAGTCNLTKFQHEYMTQEEYDAYIESQKKSFTNKKTI